MAVDDAVLERLHDDLLAASRDSEHRMRGEIAQSISASETRLETRRHMSLVAEDLTSKIVVVAEGAVTLTERLGAEMRQGFEIVDRRLLRLETRLSPRPSVSRRAAALGAR